MDIHSYGLTGEKIATLGVALSYHMYDPREFTVLYPDENMSYPEGYLSSVRWPYTDTKGKVWTAEEMLTAHLFNDPSPRATTVLKMKETAEKNGVGFMVGEWGIFGTPPGELLTESYDRDVIYAFNKDVIETLEKHGIAWCIGNGWFGEYGLVSSYPAMKGVDYQSQTDSNLYVDPGMLKFYQGILK
jgi:hypothetical protein